MGGAKKYGVVFVSALFAVVAIVVGMFYYKAGLPKETAAPPTTGKAATETVAQETEKQALAALFHDEAQVFLAATISDSAIEEVKKSLGDDPEQEALLAEVAAKWRIQKQLNQMFEEPVLVGKTINESAQLKGTVKPEEQEALLTELTVSDITDPFATVVQQILATGSSATRESSDDQATDEETDEALAKLEIVVKDGQVVEGFSLESYLAARDAIEALPESTQKNQMSKALKLAGEVLSNMGYDLSLL